MHSQSVKLKLLLGAIVCGFFASLGTANIVNESGISLPEIKHHGYPIAWRITNLNGATEYVLINFAVDTVFWITIFLFTLVFLEKVAFPNLGIEINRKMLLLLIVLFIPLGLVMDLVHESGHALWGTAVGGRLTYMQVTYLEIYPRLAITPQFQLGLARVEGLEYGSVPQGLMLLGGSMTTNIASWILALILLTSSLGNKAQATLKLLGPIRHPRYALLCCIPATRTGSLDIYRRSMRTRTPHWSTNDRHT